MTGRVGDFLDTASLGYRYEGIDTVSGTPSSETPAAGSTVSEESEARVLAQEGGLTLRGNTETLELPAWISEEGEEEAAPVLTIEDLDFEKAPVGYYEVYINLPEGVTADYKTPYYVGNLSFFGFGPQAKEHHKPIHAFDIGENIKKLRASGEWKDGQKPKITFVKREAEMPTGVVIEEEEDPPVKIGKVTISTP